MFSIAYHLSFVDALCSTLVCVPAPILTIIVSVSLCHRWITGLEIICGLGSLASLEFPFVVFT